ncbi:MAG: alpha/beta fold hydrolase [Candidatus Omnitrophica bacterium]|nr:alpha/beta fold hydrolase [Candidatus Omnitrophota bacterium]
MGAIRKLDSFKPAWWCPGAHAQTLVGGLFRRVEKPALHRRRFETPDGDFLDVDFLEQSSPEKDTKTPLIVILHGLEGSSRSPYIQNLLGEIQRRGWDAAAMNLRMCSGEANRLPATYHSGKSEDLDFILDSLTKMNGARKFYLVGYSIGGNIVLKWLGEEGARASLKVERAVAISVPYDLTKCVSLMDRGWNREVYTRALLWGLKAKVRAKSERFPDEICYNQIKDCKTFTLFDREVTARLNGFKDEKEYWSKTSSLHFLKHIQVKTRLIHAEDDPFFPGSWFPREEVRRSDFLEALMVPSGGHLGFVMGKWPWEQEPWLERTILDFLHP